LPTAGATLFTLVVLVENFGVFSADGDSSDALGYDTDIFWDTNGDVYATWSGNNNAIDKIYSTSFHFNPAKYEADRLKGIYQNKIDIATGTSLTEAQLIFHGTLPDNSTARPEGPHIYHINSTYYLLIAEGNCL
jgi:beta-xylosidase